MAAVLPGHVRPGKEDHTYNYFKKESCRLLKERKERSYGRKNRGLPFWSAGGQTIF